MGKELYRTHDEEGIIIVSQRGNKRLLSFDSMLEQSCILLNKPHYLMHEYLQAMLLGLLFTNNHKHIIILGLGAGALVNCLSFYFPLTKIDVVEIRKAVIDIAYQWFNLPTIDNLTIIHADALQYVSLLKPGSCEILFSDLYEANGMAACQAQTHFITSSFQALSDTGCLVLNFHQRPKPDSILMQTITNLFEDVIVLDAGEKNSILYCCKDGVALHELELDRRAEIITQQLEMPLMFYYRKLERC